MQIPLVDLTAQYRSIQSEIDTAIHCVLESGQFILGSEVSSLEEEVSAYLGVKYGIGVASGTDALILALRAFDIGPGDEVIVPAYSFFATAGAVLSVGAVPVFADIDTKTYCIDPELAEKAVTSRTKAIIPVHLYGHPAHMNPILKVADAHNLVVIEDNAQAFGAEYYGQKTGSFGHAACLSFFPTKNLGCYGDGGMVVTNDEHIAFRIKSLRTHGWKKKYFPEELGYNSRLDALQAAILRIKLSHVGEWNHKRSELAQRYNQKLSSVSLKLPYERAGCRHVYHLYIIRSQRRNELITELKSAGIACEIYYPQPLHLTDPCRMIGYKPGDFPISEQASRETLAIPLFPELTIAQQDKIIAAIKNYFNG